jgi:hypothetical protein
MLSSSLCLLVAALATSPFRRAGTSGAGRAGRLVGLRERRSSGECREHYRNLTHVISLRLVVAQS